MGRLVFECVWCRRQWSSNLCELSWFWCTPKFVHSNVLSTTIITSYFFSTYHCLIFFSPFLILLGVIKILIAWPSLRSLCHPGQNIIWLSAFFILLLGFLGEWSWGFLLRNLSRHSTDFLTFSPVFIPLLPKLLFQRNKKSSNFLERYMAEGGDYFEYMKRSNFALYFYKYLTKDFNLEISFSRILRMLCSIFV